MGHDGGLMILLSFSKVVLGHLRLKADVLSFRPNELVVLIDDGFQENSSKYIEENFPLSTIKDKSLIEQNSLVTATAVISWKGISIISLWAFIILISIGVNERYSKAEI